MEEETSAKVFARPLGWPGLTNRLQTTHKFYINKGTKLILKPGSIVDYEGDAIVNSTTPDLQASGSADRAIHRRAGINLQINCNMVPSENGIRCHPGDAVITQGFNLPVKYVIHTASEYYRREEHNKPILTNCYKNCLRLANEYNLKNLAFSAISCGNYRYPLFDAAEVAFDTIKVNSGCLKEIHFIMFRNIEMEQFLKCAEIKFSKILDIEYT